MKTVPLEVMPSFAKLKMEYYNLYFVYIIMFIVNEIINKSLYYVWLYFRTAQEYARSAFLYSITVMMLYTNNSINFFLFCIRSVLTVICITVILLHINLRTFTSRRVCAKITGKLLNLCNFDLHHLISTMLLYKIIFAEFKKLLWFWFYGIKCKPAFKILNAHLSTVIKQQIVYFLMHVWQEVVMHDGWQHRDTLNYPQ